MQDAHLLDTLTAQIDELQRRLRALETAPRMPFTTQTGGSFVLVSPNTSRNMRLFGGFGSFFGDVEYDGSGNSVLMVRDDKDGLVKPDIHLSLYPRRGFGSGVEYIPVSAAAFTKVWSGSFRRAYHDVYRVALVVTSDAATVGQVRLREIQSNTSTTVLNTTAGTQQLVSFDWIHPCGIGDDGNGHLGEFAIEVLRVSGAGNINVYAPNYSTFTSSALVFTADTSGNAQIV